MKHIVLICATKAHFNGRSLDTEGLGGIETTVIGLAQALAALGYKVTAVTRGTPDIEHKGVSWRSLSELPNISCDVAIACNDARHFSKLASVRRKFIWLHNPLQFERAVRKKQFFSIIRHRPELVCVGKDQLSRLSLFLPFGRSYVIGHGISDAFFEAPRAPLAERKNRVIWVSQPHRGLARTLRSWVATVLPAVPDAEFHAFGATAEYCGMSKEELRKANVTLHPRATKQMLASFYSTAKLLLYPGAKDETYCLAAAEAQCMGIPVVTRGIGSLKERVTHGVSGLIARRHRDFAKAAVSVLTDDTLWLRLSEGAQALRPQLTWQAAALKWQVIIEE